VTFHRAACQGVGANVFCSEYLGRRTRLKGTVIYNPVSSRLFDSALASEPGSDTIVAAGRFVEEKGFSTLIQAMRRVDGRLVLAGDGPLRTSLQSLSEDIGVASRVQFAGALGIEALQDLYLAAAGTCVPSLWHEPFGYALAEAMASQTPVAAFSVGAANELLADHRGYLSLERSPVALADQLNQMLNDPAERLIRANRAFEFGLTHFHPRVVARQYEALYQR